MGSSHRFARPQWPTARSRHYQCTQRMTSYDLSDEQGATTNKRPQDDVRQASWQASDDKFCRLEGRCAAPPQAAPYTVIYMESRIHRLRSMLPREPRLCETHTRALVTTPATQQAMGARCTTPPSPHPARRGAAFQKPQSARGHTHQAAFSTSSDTASGICVDVIQFSMIACPALFRPALLDGVLPVVAPACRFLTTRQRTRP